MSISHTNIHFAYGGNYSENGEEFKWISGGSMSAISFKSVSMEEITYYALVDKICKKIDVEETTTKLKLSYIPLVANPHRESSILDDEDVFVYLTTLDKEGLRSVLHVEIIKDLEINQRGEQVSRVGQASSFGVNYGMMGSSSIADDEVNACSLTIYRAEESGKNNELMENYVPREEFAAGDNHGGDGLDGMNEDEYVDLPRDVENQFVVEWEDGARLEEGQEFCSKEALRNLVDIASHKNCFVVKTYKSDPGRLILKCRQAEVGCKWYWYIHATKVRNSSYFCVRVYMNMHTCSRAVASTNRSKRKGTPRIVASVLHDKYPGQVDTPPAKSVSRLVQIEAGVSVSYSTSLRGKKLAVSELRGSPERSFSLLYSYIHILEHVNPGTVTSVKLDAEKKFKYLFIALEASIEGFRAMRKVIVVDATFIKNLYGGMVVFATAQDPNHHHYPIAMGVIDRENDASWRWFFETLKTAIPDDPELVFMNDRHPSIIKAVKEVYVRSQHGYCVWHLSQNVKGKASKGSKDLVSMKFIDCAHMYTEEEFNRAYRDFRRMFPKAVEYVDETVATEKWARCYFKGDKYNVDTSNSCESMNSVFRNVRKYPLLSQIVAYLEKVSEWFNKHRKDSAGASYTKKLVPFVENEMHARCAIATHLIVTELNSFKLEYNVIGLDGKTYVVKLLEKSCCCRHFDVDKFPCVHAIAANMALMGEGRENKGY